MTPSLTVDLPFPIEIYFGVGSSMTCRPTVKIVAIRLIHIAPCENHTSCRCHRESFEEVKIANSRVGKLIPHLFGGMENEWLSTAKKTRVFSIVAEGQLEDGRHIRLDLRQSVLRDDANNWMVAADAIRDHYREWRHITMIVAMLDFMRKQRRRLSSWIKRPSATPQIEMTAFTADVR